MRCTRVAHTLALAAVLAGGLALPATAEPDRRAGPAGTVSAWLQGFFASGRFVWLAGEVGSGVDPDGATAAAAGDAGSGVDPNGAAAAAESEAGHMVDPDG
jgi:anti-sigma factor RsiW